MQHKHLYMSTLIAATFAASAAPPPDTAGTIPTPKGSVDVGIGDGGIKNEELVGVLNPDGATASVQVTIKPIPLAASTDSPHCAPYRVNVAGIVPSLDVNRMSSCVRVCIRPPAGGYEINAGRGVTGTLSQAWSAIFNPEWYADTKIMCTHVKQWSAHSDVTAILTVGVCPAGSGCANTVPPSPAPSLVAQQARSVERYVSPRSRRLSE